MAQTTSINLGDHFTDFVTDLTNRGRYGSVGEAVREALRLLEQEEARMTALENALVEGEESGESNQPINDIVAEAIAQCKVNLDAE